MLSSRQNWVPMKKDGVSTFSKPVDLMLYMFVGTLCTAKSGNFQSGWSDLGHVEEHFLQRDRTKHWGGKGYSWDWRRSMVAMKREWSCLQNIMPVSCQPINMIWKLVSREEFFLSLGQCIWNVWNAEGWSSDTTGVGWSGYLSSVQTDDAGQCELVETEVIMKLFVFQTSRAATLHYLFWIRDS